MIELRGTSVIYPNGVRVLSNTDLFIDRGEFVFLVGPTGSGKSTLLRLIYRDIIPAFGEVWVNGQNIGVLKRSQVPYLRRKMGIVFQDFKLLPDKTIFDNIAYAMEVIGASRHEIRRKVPRVLGLVGLASKASSHPEELSGGEQQRAAIARAIVNDPAILIADEPTGNLDPDTAWELMQILQKINMRGTTLLVATHNGQIVDRLRKRVIVLIDGNIVEDKEKGVYSYGAKNSGVFST